ncbi:MAG: peptide ABC transporter permease [Chloroflexota bacterium]|nr:MAG: peptide ABC transporter permease [Chloroflexota bacterium]
MGLHTLTGFQAFPLFASDAGVTGRSSLRDAGPTLGLPHKAAKSAQEVQERTYWGAVASKLWHDKITMAAIFLLLFMITITLAAPWIANNLLGFDPIDTNLRTRNKAPTWTTAEGRQICFSAPVGQCHWLGTDEAGRDVLARGIYGGRISLRIGAYVAGISMTLGVIMGLISGYYAATFIDDIINAVIQTLGSIPQLFLLIILAGTFPFFRTPEGLSLLIGALGWMGLSRLLRGQIFSIREREYVVASRGIGASVWRVMFRHILPNVSSIIIVIAVFDIAGAIIAEAGLSYLGVGIGPPNPSWGNMMQGSLGNFTDAPWLVIAPGIFIFLTTLAIYLIGDGLRDALDPWVKQGVPRK